MPRQTIADATYELLANLRSATSEELAEPITAAGLTRARSPVQAVSRALNADRRFRRLDDDRWVAPAQLLEGAVLTHRPTPQEIENGTLSAVPDLAPFMFAAPVGLATVDGTPLDLVWDAEARELTGLVEQRVLRHHAVDHAESEGLFRAQKLSEEKKLERPARADQPRQEERATGVRHQSDADESLVEPRLGGTEQEVAAQR